MGKLVNGLTAISLVLPSSYGCTAPESPPRATSLPSAEQTPSVSPGTLERVGRCSFHFLEAENKPKACEVARAIGVAILEGKPVAFAKGFVWHRPSTENPGCIIQPVVAEVDGQGYMVSVGGDVHTPQMVIYELPEGLPGDLDIQQEPIQQSKGGGDYVSATGEPVGQTFAVQNNLCSQGFSPPPTSAP